MGGRSRCQKTEIIFKKAVFRPGQSFATICNLPILGEPYGNELGRQTFSMGSAARAREEIRRDVLVTPARVEWIIQRCEADLTSGSLRGVA